MKITGKIILASVLFFVLSLIPNLTKAAGATTCSHLAYDGSRQVAYQTFTREMLRVCQELDAARHPLMSILKDRETIV